MATTFEAVPIAQFKQGLFFKGRKIGGEGREVKLTDKKSGRAYSKFVHEFAILDCSDAMEFTAKNQETKVYSPVTPDMESKVAVWATKSLHEKLSMFPEGTVLVITETGTEDAGGEFKRRKFDIKMEAK